MNFTKMAKLNSKKKVIKIIDLIENVCEIKYLHTRFL